jgi:hypothetical protein
MREQRAVRRGPGKRSLTWAVALVTALTMGAPARARAQSAAQAVLPAFGMIGLARGQVARLNGVLVGRRDASHPGCRVTASFVGENGRVLRDRAGNPFTKTFSLRPQIADTLSLNSADILSSTQSRRSIRAVLTPVNDGMPSNCGCLVINNAVENPDGQTAVLDYGNDMKEPRFPNPPPPPPICPDLVVPVQ